LKAAPRTSHQSVIDGIPIKFVRVPKKPGIIGAETEVTNHDA